MILDQYQKEIEIEKNKCSSCECCQKDKSDYLYITKMRETYGLFHICDVCAYDPVNVNVEYEWTLIKKNV